MAERTLTIEATITQLADIRIALAYAHEHAEKPEIREAYRNAYTTICNLILDAVEQE